MPIKGTKNHALDSMYTPPVGAYQINRQIQSAKCLTKYIKPNEYNHDPAEVAHYAAMIGTVGFLRDPNPIGQEKDKKQLYCNVFH